MNNKIGTLYKVLFDHFGPQHWWPGETPIEIMVGAVLTQNTNWTNVSRAIDNLKQAGLLSFEKLLAAPPAELAALIKPSGYYNLKTSRLKNLLTHIHTNCNGSLAHLFALETAELRQILLSAKGIGPETADSIILYAANKPVFVVDAYTHRILFRHQMLPEETSYAEVQELFTSTLPEDAALFNEYHALLVRLGKEFCRKRAPRCSDCPVKDL